MSRHSHTDDPPRGHRRVCAVAGLAALAVAGLVVTAAVRPNLVRNTVTDPRTLLYGLVLVVVVAALFLGVRRLSGHAAAAAGVAAVPVVLALALVVVPSFRTTTVNEADPLAGLPPAVGAAAARTPSVTTPTTTATAPAAAPAAETAVEPVVAAPPEAPREVGAAELTGIDHDVRGTASIIDVGDGTSVVRFAGFDVEPGPDYFVHVVPGADARTPDGGVLLGRLKGTQGDQNYAVPAGTDLSGDVTVLIWCRAFVTPVANATISL